MRYRVTHPIAGHVTVEVEANSRQEAIEKTPDAFFEMSDDEQAESLQWDWHEKIAEGHVLYAELNEVEIEVLGNE